MKRLEHIPYNSQKAKEIQDFYQIYATIVEVHTEHKINYLVLKWIMPSAGVRQRLEKFGIHFMPSQLDDFHSFGMFYWDKDWEPANPFIH